MCKTDSHGQECADYGSRGTRSVGPVLHGWAGWQAVVEATGRASALGGGGGGAGQGRLWLDIEVSCRRKY
ncbi:hypothetical protein J1614_010887 [Plenodomus biglobosus]|nr:hypothetical protein J1614_010887 [Plenodomus biglobosus]